MKAQNLFAIFALVLASSSAAQADTLVCTDAQNTIKVRVNESVMVLSDPAVAGGRKTIARFTAANGVLETQEDDANGTVYFANVDLRFSDSARSGEYLLGTRLGEVDVIEVSAGNGDSSDEPYIRIIKRDGSRKYRGLICE